ncbi:MAG: hypothetical protein RQ750_18300 [Roseovarius sp.]|nr:hypothetical protein [Roseovarius sp.]
MDHREFVSALPRDVLATLNETADGPGLWHLVVIMVFGLWIMLGWSG